MSQRDAATLYHLQQPQKLDKALAEDRAEFEDCTPCRLMGKHAPISHSHDFETNVRPGASAFIGLGVYSYASGSYQLRQQRAALLQSKSMFGMRSRQAGITGISAILIGLGIYRLVN
ncbi:Exosome complex component rrp4 [Coniosporium tulheliwenetii]|uniref:Exosome complex component rrp4 n=1 Tax=Coniosporium tulheliwenetii TaxID=3383036 RepID=A0ACC2Z095_9PEZI|nr:Exosome complex component rrp4 [Cladosporium sp. JES 115]